MVPTDHSAQTVRGWAEAGMEPDGLIVSGEHTSLRAGPDCHRVDRPCAGLFSGLFSEVAIPTQEGRCPGRTVNSEWLAGKRGGPTKWEGSV